MSLRLLCVSEGATTAGPQGHQRIEAAIRAGLEQRRDVDARFVELGGLGRWGRAATRGVPGLRAADLDLYVSRWHAVQGWRARRLIAGALDQFPADAMTIISHAVTLGLGREMRRVPTLLSVDATVAQVRAMALWRPLRRWSDAQLAASLALERRTLERAAVVLAWSEWVRREVARITPAAPVVVHHPGVDAATFSPAERMPRRLPRVLFVGGRFAQKGGPDLLAAAAPLLGTRLELDIVTQDPVTPRPGVRNHRLTAGDPSLVDLFQQADALCLPSRGDAAPWVVLEAMACGTAVVATRTGAIPELVRDGESGMLVGLGDRRALRLALERVCDDPAAMALYGRTGRARIERDYDARRQTARLVDLAVRASSR